MLRDSLKFNPIVSMCMTIQDSGNAGKLKKGDHHIVISNWRLCDDNSLEIEFSHEQFLRDKSKNDDVRIFDVGQGRCWIRKGTDVELYSSTNKRLASVPESTRGTNHCVDGTDLVRFDDISGWSI